MVTYSMTRSLITEMVMSATTTDDKIRVCQGTWETKMAAGFAPRSSKTKSLCWKYRGALRRHRISK